MNTCLQMMTLGYLEHVHHSGFDRLLTKLMSMLSSLENGIFSPLWSKAPHTRPKLDPKGGRSLCLSGQIYVCCKYRPKLQTSCLGVGHTLLTYKTKLACLATSNDETRCKFE